MLAPRVSERIKATLNAGEPDLWWGFLMLSLTTISYEQESSTCSQQEIGIYLATIGNQPVRFIDTQA
ncbi:hypothetical protein [Pseudomonas syringae group genomosp. 3]|uniref:hypothetical protein n=1 Tax=Pseudomonas syringae group genomosp. 3 TaxID=251701 RepID=UPI000F00A921|nr:hypothetical protein [Pseudomonas syringae group genomosp. 3]RMU40343.1 hypothetical protein ALP30_00890 [Pseudomonas syringae pv. primulae]